jgi:hypothetical protein
MFEDSSPSQKRRLEMDFDTPTRIAKGSSLPVLGTPSSGRRMDRLESLSPSGIAAQLAREVSEHSKCKDKREVFVIGIAGGTASGKTTLTNAIMGSLRDHRVRSISMDSFYRSLTPEEIANAHSTHFKIANYCNCIPVPILCFCVHPKCVSDGIFNFSNV